MKIETYPEKIMSDNDYPLYYLEFIDWEDNKPVRWKLYKRNFVYLKEDWKQLLEKMSKFEAMFASREGHPYALLEDVVHSDSCIPNKDWLKFMVDALNEKVDKLVKYE